MARKRLCECGKVLPYNLIKCEECKDRDSRVRKHRNRIYNRYNRDQEAQAIYNDPRWQICREGTKDRDNGLCQVCIAGKKIVLSQAVHHIVSIEDSKKKAFDVNNLICLCESCHQLVHVQYDQSARSKKETQGFLLSLIGETQGV